MFVKVATSATPDLYSREDNSNELNRIEIDLNNTGG
jgi:hypothetical protein